LKTTTKLLTNPSGNSKTSKSKKYNYYTPILHLAPHKLSGYNVCPKASNGCIKACLNKAGRGGIIKKGENTNAIQTARINRTKYYFQDRKSFLNQLAKEIRLAKNRAENKGLKLAVRLNGTSDIKWENITVNNFGNNTIFELFPEIQFYDYTKLPNRITPFNYALTYSHWGNWETTEQAIDQGQNVAMVFNVKKAHRLPKMFKGRVVVDGDKTDLRTPQNDGLKAIVGLRAKMSMANINKELDKTTSFVVRA